MRARVTRPIVVVFTLAAVAVGACAAYAFIPAARPNVLESDRSILGEVNVTTRLFTDERTVTVDVLPGNDRTVTSPTSGRVTATSCTTDRSLESGAVPISVDGEPLLALATSVPLWRDLEIGAEGSDVLAVQQELNRLGFPVDADGELGLSSVRAIESLRTGIAAEASEIRFSDILWLPAASTPVTACAAELGTVVEADAPLFELPPGVGRATVQSFPTDLLPGERDLVVGDARVPVEADGELLDPAGIAVLASVPADEGDGETGRRTVTAVLVLRTAVTVGVVPPSALYDLDDDGACVVSNGKPLRVAPVSSQLGETFITATGGQLPATVEITPREKPSCM